MTFGNRRYITKIEQMETEARESFDSTSSKLVHGQWLMVERTLDALNKDRFVYQYGKKSITREEAIRLIRTTPEFLS